MSDDSKIVLDRPEVVGVSDTQILGSAFAVSHYPDHVRFGWDEPGGHMLNASPENARFVASLLAAHADAAEREAVTNLGKLVRSNMPGMAGRSTDEIAEDIARAVLRAGYTPPRGET
jgi:hypothetical protein